VEGPTVALMFPGLDAVVLVGLTPRTGLRGVQPFILDRAVVLLAGGADMFGVWRGR
jgi:hypothetical protein